MLGMSRWHFIHFFSSSSFPQVLGEVPLFAIEDTSDTRTAVAADDLKNPALRHLWQQVASQAVRLGVAFERTLAKVARVLMSQGVTATLVRREGGGGWTTVIAFF